MKIGWHNFPRQKNKLYKDNNYYLKQNQIENKQKLKYATNKKIMKS